MRPLGTSRSGAVRRPSAASAPPPTRRRDKPAWYAPTALATDALGVFVPVLAAYTATGEPRPLAAAATAATAWAGVRAAHHRYALRTLGETRGLLSSLHDWLILLGLLAALRVLTGESSSLLTAVGSLAPAPFLTALAAALTHRHLTRSRRRAQALCRVLVVGEPGPVDAVTAQLAARTDHAYVVIGTVPVGGGHLTCGAPETGRLTADEPTLTLALSEVLPEGPDGSTVLDAARRLEADLILVAPGSLLTGDRLRRLSWAVHDAGLGFVIASGLSEVAPGRVRVQATAGLSLLHVVPPLRRGPQPFLKAALDRTGAALGLLLLAPLLAAVALAVRLDSSGPALYRQTRVGLRGEPFTMWKFRTMVTDAERLRPALETANDHCGGPLFKMRRDPRVTRVGRWLRRSSLDELPQLLNVLSGRMSLVGPRPPLPDEVERYGSAALRRLSVKPGLTGPWQVGGRSELSWDESLALDLSYADNWSLTGDLDVLARTFRAVVDGRGAY
ncbi:exopolysaccharide biosynthesis polyprenyl glycosylphosphotransferase [Streptomyces sp. JH002]|uniref:exopolysaccharide biosynthesis polyprenyl glycosylphosphotransferase n=1 Tax=Streptomyces sp. JH002 TaxID=2763259 RepID=UPI003D800CD2